MRNQQERQCDIFTLLCLAGSGTVVGTVSGLIYSVATMPKKCGEPNCDDAIENSPALTPVLIGTAVGTVSAMIGYGFYKLYQRCCAAHHEPETDALTAERAEEEPSTTTI